MGALLTATGGCARLSSSWGARQAAPCAPSAIRPRRTPARGKNFGLANTHVVHHAGRLLALKGVALPFAFDPVMLDFGGV
jgi:hypothetical protein